MLSTLHNILSNCCCCCCCFHCCCGKACTAQKFPVPSIMHKYDYCRYFSHPNRNLLAPTIWLQSPNRFLLTFCVFNNIYLKAQTIGQKCGNCSDICNRQKQKQEKGIEKNVEK